MYKLFYLLLFLSSTFLSFTQESTSIDFKIPIDFFKYKSFIYKFDKISPVEVFSIVKKNPSTSINQINDNAQNYNLIYYRKFNNMNQLIMSNFSKIEISTVSFRELNENKFDSLKYIIMPVFNEESYIISKNIPYEYYIYDYQNKIKYENFPSLEILVKTLSKLEKYGYDNKNINQETLNKVVEAGMPKEKKPLSPAVKWTFGIIGYGLFQTAIIYLSNL